MYILALPALEVIEQLAVRRQGKAFLQLTPMSMRQMTSG